MLCPSAPIDAAKYVSSDGVDTTPPTLDPQVFIIGGVVTVSSDQVCRDDATITNEAAEAIKAAFPVPVKSVRVQCGAQNVDCPVPLTVRGTQALVSFAPLAFKLFCAARQNAVLRRSPFPPV